MPSHGLTVGSGLGLWQVILADHSIRKVIGSHQPRVRGADTLLLGLLAAQVRRALVVSIAFTSLVIQRHKGLAGFFSAYTAQSATDEDNACAL